MVGFRMQDMVVDVGRGRDRRVRSDMEVVLSLQFTRDDGGCGF